MSSRILEHLGQLVSCDTSDPPRSMHAGDPIMRYARNQLESAGFSVEIDDLGGGSVNLLATRGTPRILFNCHLDTVAADPHWRRDPFRLSIEGDRVYGLGACDIKGAAACLLSAVEATAGDAALLFTTDEEREHGRCVNRFLASRDRTPDLVVVAEPTRGRAVTRHRGYASFSLGFSGEAGHTSTPVPSSSAAHDAVRWGARALELSGPGGPLEDARFNIGGFESDAHASNVVNSSTVVHFGFRPRPDQSANELLEEIRACVPESATVEWSRGYYAPALLPRDEELAEGLLQRSAIERGPDVDFWTEAALFGKAGLTAIVLGPGDIAQAHQADEYVAVEELQRAAAAYERILTTGMPGGDSVA